MRAKGTICWIVLLSFMVFEWSCVSLRGTGTGPTIRDASDVTVDRVGPKDANAPVYSVIKKDGKRISFPEDSPGRVDVGAEAVVGVALQQFVFAKNEIEITRDSKRNAISAIKTADGRQYKVLTSLDEGESIRANVYAPISIPMSEIQQLSMVRPHRVGRTAVGAVFAVVIGVGLGALLYVGVKAIIDGIGKSIPDWDR